MPHAAEEADALAEYAHANLGRVDLWVNNAGVSQHAKADLETAEPAELQAIVDTNLMGAMFGARAALKVRRRMHCQSGWLPHFPCCEGSARLALCSAGGAAMHGACCSWGGRGPGCSRRTGSGACS